MAGDPRGELAAVRIFTVDATIDGWIDLPGPRLSDVLNVEDLLSVFARSARANREPLVRGRA